MKIVWRTVKMLLLIGVIFIIQMKLADSQSLSVCTDIPPGSPCKLTCTTPDVTKAIFFLKLPAVSQEGGCTGGGMCAAGDARYTVTQDSSLSETYMDISNLTHAGDDSDWVCDYGAARSTTVQLTVPSIPTVVKFAPDPTTADLSQTLMGEVYCVYPVSSLTVKLVYQDGQTNSTLGMTYPVPITNGTNGCGSHEFTVIPSYQLTETTLSGKSVQFWIEVTVAGQVIGSALTTETFVFPASSTSDSETSTYVVGAFGLAADVGCGALSWIVHIKFSEGIVKQTLIAAIIVTVLCVIGIILCIVAFVIIVLALAVVGLVLPVAVTLILVIILCHGKIKKKDCDNTTTRDQPDGQEGRRPHIESNPGTESSPRSARDGSNGTPRRRLEDVPQGRKLPALELSGASQKANTLEPIEFNETKKLKKKKKRRSKEEKAQDDGEN